MLLLLPSPGSGRSTAF